MNTLVIENWRRIGAELKTAREKQGKTREQLTILSPNLHINTLYMVENSKVTPTLQTLVNWARALGYDNIVIRF